VTARIFITSPCIDISWICTVLAAGVLTSTRRVAWSERICMKAPVGICFDTVERTQGSCTVTPAQACIEARADRLSKAARTAWFMVGLQWLREVNSR